MGADVGGSSSAKSEPNVVPLCDILLVLLIIFMVVTPMIKKGANVTLAEAANTIDQPESDKMMTVYIQADGVVYLDSEKLESLSVLAGKIDAIRQEKKTEEPKVLLRADQNVPYGKVTEVMDLIRQAEIEVVGLVTDKKAGI